MTGGGLGGGEGGGGGSPSALPIAPAGGEPVDTWRIVVYQGRTSTPRTVFSNDLRASRLKGARFRFRAAPGGKPACWEGTLEFGPLEDEGGFPPDIRELDVVKVFLNDDPEPVYTGEVVELPPLWTEGTYTVAVHGSYRLDKLGWSTLDFTYTGAAVTKVRELLLDKLGELGLTADDILLDLYPLNTFDPWVFKEQDVYLDKILRDVQDFAGGDFSGGMCADGKFAFGRRPEFPIRTMDGTIVFEPRQARLATRVRVRTGTTFYGNLVVEDGPALALYGPLEVSEDYSGLVSRVTQNPVGAPPEFWVTGEGYTIAWSKPETYRQVATGQASPLEYTYLVEAHLPDGQVILMHDIHLTGTRAADPDPVNAGTDRITFPATGGTFFHIAVGQYTSVTVRQSAPIFPQVDGQFSFETTYEDVTPAITAAQNVLLEKYGPTLRATATFEGRLVLPGGRGVYRYGPQGGQSVTLLDLEGEILLDGNGFTSTVTGGSRSRFTPAQNAKIKLDKLKGFVTKTVAS